MIKDSINQVKIPVTASEKIFVISSYTTKKGIVFRIFGSKPPNKKLDKIHKQPNHTEKEVVSNKDN